MKKLFVLWMGLAVGMVWASGSGAEKAKPAGTLPPVVAQISGQANTVTMWHDIDNDGKADYEATYVFKGGKLHQMSKRQSSQKDLGIFIRREY